MENIIDVLQLFIIAGGLLIILHPLWIKSFGKLLEDMKISMRDKNVIRKNVIQMVRAAILQVEKDKQIQLEDEQIIEIIAKEAKKRKDSLSDYEKSGREDLIAQIKEEIEILSEYLPKPLTTGHEKSRRMVSKSCRTGAHPGAIQSRRQL